jgi:hypothetical protein
MKVLLPHPESAARPITTGLLPSAEHETWSKVPLTPPPRLLLMPLLLLMLVKKMTCFCPKPAAAFETVVVHGERREVVVVVVVVVVHGLQIAIMPAAAFVLSSSPRPKSPSLVWVAGTLERRREGERDGGCGATR